MSRDGPSTTTAFNKLPIELNKTIAHFLENDADIANFSAICRATNYAIDGDNFSFWRTKFREKFALIAGTKNKDLKSKYKRRSKYLRRGTGLQFIRGHTGLEKRVTAVLIDIIIESWQCQVRPDEQGTLQCPNLLVLAKFVMNSRLLLDGKRPPPAKANEPKHVNPSLAAVRLMCAHFLFNLSGVRHHVLGIDESQKAVYAPTNIAPIYIGEKKNEVNMEWCLHCFNFFHFHMKNPDASLLHDKIEELDISDKPSAWREPLKIGSYPLSKCWKGTYAFMLSPELNRIREYAAGKKPARPEDAIFSDLNVEEGAIQSVQFDFDREGKADWPDAAEQRLQSKRETLFDHTRAQHSKRSKIDPDGDASKNIQITGWGEDKDEDFYMTGWLNPLPDQSGIPGWQRITLMKHYQEQLDLLDVENHWAYEGVVLPGGRIILGRWWYASEEVDFDNDYGGPFILWAVDSAPEILPDSDDNNGATGGAEV